MCVPHCYKQSDENLQRLQLSYLYHDYETTGKQKALKNIELRKDDFQLSNSLKAYC